MMIITVKDYNKLMRNPKKKFNTVKKNSIQRNPYLQNSWNWRTTSNIHLTNPSMNIMIKYWAKAFFSKGFMIKSFSFMNNVFIKNSL